MPGAGRKPAIRMARPAARADVAVKTLLLPYQQRWVNDRSRFKIGVWGRQTGKSFSTAAEAVEDCLRHPGSVWVCLSAGERQALEWLQKAREWAEAYQLVLESYAEDRQLAEALLKSAEIRFANGSRCIAIPANPSTARGYSANVVLDEFAYHDDPDRIWAAMFPSVTNPLAGTFLERVRARLAGTRDETVARKELKVRVVSTFNGRGNKFFQLWERRAEAGWSGHKVDIHLAASEGLPVDVPALRTALDDAEAWAQEFECEPMDTSTVLLPYDLLAKAESADASETCPPDLWLGRGSPVFLGIDFGRTNDPTVCWAWELLGDTLWCREVLLLRGMSTPDQVEALRHRIARATRVCLDYTGPGVGLGDLLVQTFGEYDPQAHRFGKVELDVFTLGFKRELFPTLRRWFEAGKLRIPISREVREDLHSMQQVISNGEYNYWAPRTREGHSDRCTAAALGVRAAGAGARGIVDAGGIKVRSPYFLHNRVFPSGGIWTPSRHKNLTNRVRTRGSSGFGKVSPSSWLAG